jgi:hypothetical protein
MLAGSIFRGSSLAKVCDRKRKNKNQPRGLSLKNSFPIRESIVFVLVLALHKFIIFPLVFRVLPPGVLGQMNFLLN